MCEYALPCPFCHTILGDSEERACSKVKQEDEETLDLRYACPSCGGVVQIRTWRTEVGAATS